MADNDEFNKNPQQENQQSDESYQFNTQPVQPDAQFSANNVNVTTPGADDGKNWSIAALVCGIVGIVGGWFPVVQYFTTVAAILGIIFGVKGRKLSVAAYGKASGLATAGLVLGIIGTAIAALGIICLAVCGSILAGAAGAAALS